MRPEVVTWYWCDKCTLTTKACDHDGSRVCGWFETAGTEAVDK